MASSDVPPTRTALHRRALRNPEVIVFTALAILAFLAAAAPVTTNDLFWHIETGKHLVAVGRFPATDVFSYTAGDLPWFLHEWLTQVCFFALHELGGLTLLRVFTGWAAAFILFLFWRFARKNLGKGIQSLVVLVPFAILVTSRFQTRPTLFSIAFFLGLVSWLTAHRSAWRARDGALVTGVVLVWVNLHSVGLLAVVVYAAFVSGRAVRAWIGPRRSPWSSAAWRHLVTLLAALAATCCSPSSWHIWAFAYQDKSEVMNFIVDEWGAFQLDFAANPTLTPEAYGVVLVILFVIALVYLLTGIALNGEKDRLRSPAMPDPVHLAMLVLCAGGGLMARRFHWMLGISLVLALHHAICLLRHGHLTGLLRPRLWSTLATALTALFVGLHYHRDLRYEDSLLHVALGSRDYYTRAIAPSLDLEGVRFLREAGLTGNAFCHYGSGGILSYFLYPNVKVFIDSRADLFRREVLLDFLAIRDGHPDQQRLLDRYETDIYYRHWEISDLREPTHWAKVYSGPDGEIYLRKRDRNLANVERCRAWHRENGTTAAPR